MKKVLAVAFIISSIIFVAALMMYMNPTKGQTETMMFDLDIPTRDNHIIAVAVTVDYRQKNTEVLLARDEIDDRVYSNLIVAFRLATTGISFEELQGGLLKNDTLRGEVDKCIAYFNNAPYEIVEIKKYDYLLTFDPPANPEDGAGTEDMPEEEDAATQPLNFRQLKEEREVPI